MSRKLTGYTDFGEYMLHLREINEESMPAMAKRLGVSQATIASFNKGHRKPTHSFLRRLLLEYQIQVFSEEFQMSLWKTYRTLFIPAEAITESEARGLMKCAREIVGK